MRWLRFSAAVAGERGKAVKDAAAAAEDRLAAEATHSSARFDLLDLEMALGSDRPKSRRTCTKRRISWI